MPDVRSQPEPRASSTFCATPGHRPRRRTQHQAPAQGFKLRPRPTPVTTAVASPRVPLARATRIRSRVPCCSPSSRLGPVSSLRLWGGHLSVRRISNRARSVRAATTPFRQVAGRPRLRSESQAPLTGTTRVSRSHQAPYVAAISASPHKPSCGLTSACSGLAALAADARR